VLLSVNAACTSYRPIRPFNPGALAPAEPLAGTPLTEIWNSRPVRGPSTPVALDTETAYVGGSDRRVVAVDLRSGRTRWAVRLTGPLVGGVVRYRDMVLAGTDRPGGRVVALEAASGNKLWSTGSGYVQATVTVVGDRVIAVNREAEVLALDARTGRSLWRHPLRSSMVAPLALDSARVLITAQDSLYLVRVSDGRVTLRRRSPGTVTADWLVLGDQLIGATGDSLLVAISPDSLATLWTVRADAPLLASPTSAGDTVFCVTQRGSLYRVELSNGIPASRQLRPEGWPATGTPALFGAWLLVGGSDGELRAIDRADGAIAWSAQLGRPFEAAPLIIAGDTFLALGGRGDFHRIRQ